MPNSILLPSGSKRLAGLGSGWQQPPLLSASHVVTPFGAGVHRRRRALCHAQGDGKPATGGTDDFWHLQRPFNLSPSSGRQALSLVPSNPQQGTSPVHGTHGLTSGTFQAHLGSTTPQQQPSRGAGEISWQQWLSYFDSVDAAAERKEQLALELKDAVRLENYSAAAQIKAELSVLESEDAVAVLRRQLDRALSEERYTDAAQLRDASLAGLAGWWAGQAENDPVGHLLHITPEHSRWTGCVFRPRDIAELKVQKQDPFGRSSPRPSFGPSSKPSGSPILEVFLRPEAGAGSGSAGGSGAGGYVHQAVSLRLPTSDEVEQRRKKSAHAPQLPRPSSQSASFVVRTDAADSLHLHLGRAGDAAPTMARGGESRSPFVRLSVSIRRDGSARIAGMLPSQPSIAPPPPPPPPPPASWDPDVEETKRILRWSAPSHGPEGLQAPPSGLSAAANGHTLRQPVDPLAFNPDGVVHLPDLGSEDVVDITSQHAMSSLDAEDGAMADHNLGRGFGGLSQGGHGPVGGMYQADDGLEEFYAELMRLPAEVEMLGRDQMVFHLPEDPAAAILLNSRRFGAGAEQSGALLPMRVPGMPGSAPVPYPASDPSLAEEGTSSIEVIVPMAMGADCGPSGAAREGSAAVLSAPTDAAELATETLNILADQVAQSMEAKVGHSAPREEIAEALREVVRRVASGEQMSSVDVLLGGEGGRADMFSTPVAAAASAASATSAATKMTSVFYKRLPVTQSRTDPLSGLFLGSFGPHGPELLYLSRTTVDGEEMVHATKVTGDHNVPAGLVSFKAKIGRKQKLDAREVYPEELGVTARYKGEGRVAQKNFTHARWVEGELLVFNSKGNPLTAGAELGFVWSVPGEKRFLILLNRVDLNDVGK